MISHRHFIKIPWLILGTFLISQLIISQAYSAEPIDSESLSRGAKAWANNCSRCHNARPATEYTPKQWRPIMFHMRIQAGLTGQEAEDIYNYLATQSEQTTMAPLVYKQLASNAPLTKLVAVKKTRSSNETKQQSTSSSNSGVSGSKVYSETCVACHGKNGQGALPGVPDFAKVLNQSDKVLFNRIKNGYKSAGSSMAMPPKGGNPSLSDEDIKAVLSYIKTSFGSDNQRH